MLCYDDYNLAYSKKWGGIRVRIFNQLKEPIFLKEESSSKVQLKELEILYQSASEEIKRQIEKDIKCIEYGIKGEEQIAFELKNSHMPMYILHDIYLEFGELSAQIDYIVITRKGTFIIECKNLFGDVTINHKGDFIRTIYYGGKSIKEGIYSPITQNVRHMEMIKALRLQEKKNVLSKAIFEKFFNENYHSVVVFANSKSVIKDTYAPKEIKQQVIKSDQLIQYIQKVNHLVERQNGTDKQMLELAEFFLSKHCEKKVDYTKKYRIELSDNKTEQETEVIKDKIEKIEEDEEKLVEKLKTYRLEQSRMEQVKPYFIFNNQQMMDVIKYKPKTIDELLKISGFGKVKCEKYGQSILKILYSEDV